MSKNLHLEAPANQRAKKPRRTCGLYSTPTLATDEIYQPGDSKYEVLMRYFKYLDEEWAAHVGIGAILDHKLSVAMFLVENPDAEWSAW